ncbi:MAG TPA: hypothetical protein VGK19_24320 [Capsulimonadaceae bacterium]|jgi:uncharacterized protein (DUF697 family)
MRDKITVAMRIWNVVKGMSTSELRDRMDQSVLLTVYGSDTNIDLLIRRLATEKAHGEPGRHEGGSVAHLVRRETVPQPTSAIAIDADMVAGNEQALQDRMTTIATEHPDLRIALAKTYPAFRPTVTNILSHVKGIFNGKLAGMSALPGIIPAGDWLLPFTAAGDMVVLTRNQVELFLEVAACYDIPPDLQARVREFALVVGNAFLWRAAARQLIGMAPVGIGVAVKAGVAYAGTYAIGRAAAAYYHGGGHTLTPADIKRYVREGLKTKSLPK